MNKGDADEILKKVRENHARLKGCPGPHDFEVCEVRGSIPNRYRCKDCSGEVDMHAFHWYSEGISHGKKNQ